VCDVTSGAAFVKLFADDLKFYSDVRPTINESSVDLQTRPTLNNLVDWAAKWQMEIAHNKCCLITCGNKSHDVRSPYRIDSFILPSVLLWIARLNSASIATNCALKPVFVLDKFYVVFDASVLYSLNQGNLSVSVYIGCRCLRESCLS